MGVQRVDDEHVGCGRCALGTFVANAGGKALEWFKDLFCSEMTEEEFYGDFIPQAVDTWLNRESGVSYIPYLMGSRYSLEPVR